VANSLKWQWGFTDCFGRSN